MKYKVVLRHSDEGVSVSVRGLPGCWSQDATEAEALENVHAACWPSLATPADKARFFLDWGGLCS
jgi:hypothetical protein